jgi:riboflavin kinase/FMN adenylyltransferase
MLGRPYSISGKVVRGEGRGRRLTYPTANLAGVGEGKMLPPAGVYAAWVGMGGRMRKGVLYVGARPTYGAGPVMVEIHVLDWTGSLYGRTIEAHFVRRLRAERVYRREAGLRRAISRDVGAARAALEN